MPPGTKWKCRQLPVTVRIAFRLRTDTLFGIVKNSYCRRPFAVFRIECEEREPAFVSLTVPDPITTKSLTIETP